MNINSGSDSDSSDSEDAPPTAAKPEQPPKHNGIEIVEVEEVLVEAEGAHAEDSMEEMEVEVVEEGDIKAKVLASAEAEGLQLHAADNNTGYRGVAKNCNKRLHPFEAKAVSDAGTVYLGCFATAEEAALAVARAEATGGPFEVEAVLDQRTTAEGDTEYLIKWAGFGDAGENSWEPQTNVHDDLIAEYEAAQQRGDAGSCSSDPPPPKRARGAAGAVQRVWTRHQLDALQQRAEPKAPMPVSAATKPAAPTETKEAPASAAQQPMTAKEALAAAKREGLQLVLATRADTASGYKTVAKDPRPDRGKPWRSHYREKGETTSLGYFATKEEAALAYARHIGNKPAAPKPPAPKPAASKPAASKPAASKPDALPQGAKDALAAARREGLQLVPAHTNASGYRGVVHYPNKSNPWNVVHYHEGNNTSLGYFATKEEAALTYARHIGKDEAARLTAEAPAPRPPPLTAKEALAAAKREGLKLVPAQCNSGFKGVKHVASPRETPWLASCYHDVGHTTSLGYFATKEEAALVYARYIGKDEAARLTAEETYRERTMTAKEAKVQAQVEGLTLVPVNTADWSEKLTGPRTTKFRGVRRDDSGSSDRPFLARGSANAYLGRCVTPEAAALLFARSIGAKASAELAKFPRLSPKGASLLLKRFEASAAKPSGAIKKKAAKSIAKVKTGPKAAAPTAPKAGSTAAASQVAAAKAAASKAVASKVAAAKASVDVAARVEAAKARAATPNPAPATINEPPVAAPSAPPPPPAALVTSLHAELETVVRRVMSHEARGSTHFKHTHTHTHTHTRHVPSPLTDSHTHTRAVRSRRCRAWRGSTRCWAL